MTRKQKGDAIRVVGARQNNLRNLTLDVPLNELVVVTGVSGSGKSSLVFDTVYAEGQRRYVETFSPYARQFLDRMDRPQVDRIDGIPPAIAIDQTNPVRTSRSTVGTMTELNDHLKLLFARAAQLFCSRCARPVRRDTPQSICADLQARAAAAGDPRLLITFLVEVPGNFSDAEVLKLLAAQGYARIHARGAGAIEVVQDRLRAGNAERVRVVEALEAALKVGRGRVNVHALAPPAPERTDGAEVAQTWRYSSDLHCPDCDLHYREPTPGLFSFNSPVGACETCRGFGRVIGVDYGLVIPDASRTLRGGAIRPWQTQSYSESQRDLETIAKKRGIPLDAPWRELTEAERAWVLDGEPDFVSWEKSWPGSWYGVRRFFAWLETKAYKMHIRVLLSKYRAYTDCPACNGARLKPEALLFRLGTTGASAGGGAKELLRPPGVQWTEAQLRGLPGLCVHDVMLLPIDRVRACMDALELPAPLDEATDLLLAEIRARLNYLVQVGLGYLTLDRQSRTLSGGEVQRINLTTALGTSLVNTLFVLDEPSIGLHPRDMGRIIEVMQRLRDAGNSLLVVEHDPQVMFAADRLLDIGPGPGERGGEVVFFGTPEQLASAPGSLTADYLHGRRRIGSEHLAWPVTAETPRLELLGARAHNLKDIDVSIPLQRLVCVTGVSGSGKSTLVQDVLYPALLKRRGKPTEAPGVHRDVRGDAQIAEVVMVDQSPIGRTTRSNPASYVGAFDAIRALFAATPLAKVRGYTAGTFSFNTGNGRCPTCSGNGFEHVEMQFLSDVYLRCPDCDGRRFREEVLEVRHGGRGRAGRNIAEVLGMTVSEAAAYFAGEPAVLQALAPLVDVGLDYLKLGQPVPTLSGGEAQRLKLAGFLAAAGRGRGPARKAAARAREEPGALYLFDEPTTGLHFEDIARLLHALRKLISAGHSVVVIEHNLEVIGASDWVIDLGPEGGEGGGEVVAVGAPDQLRHCTASHTGAALGEYQRSLQRLAARAATGHVQAAARGRSGGSRKADNAIRIHHAREHNLKNIDVRIPRGEFTVITGVSGSGKSTLAFDIVFAEGQRRYLESLNAYARQFVQPASRPDVDAVLGIPPTVAIEQRTSRGGRKSTVGTLTEIQHFLRLLYVKLGVQHCPDCAVAIEPQSEEMIAARLLRDYRGRSVTLLAPLIVARKGLYTELAKWASARGYEHLRVDGQLLPTVRWPRLDRYKEHTIELPVAEISVAPRAERELRAALRTALEHGKGVVHVVKRGRSHVPRGKLTPAPFSVFSTRRACPSCGRSFGELDPRLFSYNSKHGWCETCYGTGELLHGFAEDQTGEEVWWTDYYEGWHGETARQCPDCHGRRLNPVACAVRFRDLSIADVSAQAVAEVRRFFDALKLRGREAEIARDILAELRARLGFLEEVGLGYLALDRGAPTLSGGEAQRIRLAAQLGSNLRGVCYILDEPTIGLHTRDNRLLLDTLTRLKDKGNTLLVVEHDEDTIRCATHVIDIGPGAGTRGGRIIAEGTAQDLQRNPESLTGRYLAVPLAHPLLEHRGTSAATPALTVRGASLHNLREIDVRLPLQRLVCVTGVSGSGKSTLAREVLRENLQRLVHARRGKAPLPYGCDGIEGHEQIARVLEVDQAPIGKTPRSCPATYVGFWDDIRRIYAQATESRMRGWTASRFSFNTAGGRCPACEGQGVTTIEMSFLPQVKVTCESCRGARFNPETLAVRYKDRTIGELLAMNVDDALEFFGAHVKIQHALRLLQDVGLGYLTLGQQSQTLSGGEAQRIKLVTELAKVRLPLPAPRGRAAAARNTLYILDEPTVGLHMADVEKLIRVLHRLVDAGNTVVVIEHNLDVIADADWIVDLGPEGGEAGGRIVAEGPPSTMARKAKTSHTGRALAEFLSRHAAARAAS
ncbi:MAG: UvrABC system protein A [Gammaproteobacteria bacterium]|nr:UvrABC system protein A [Gammaproteobacteria bacterium]